MAQPYKRADSPFYWVMVKVGGRRTYLSTGETELAAAKERQVLMQADALRGVIVRPSTALFSDLLEFVRTDYKNKDRRSLRDLEIRIDKHLDPFLGSCRAMYVNSSLIADYIEHRKGQGAANATVNRELAVVKRAFALGIDAEIVLRCPKIEMLPEDNVRRGFYSTEDIAALMRHANPLLQDVILFAYYTGWRLRSILTLEWRNVDFASGFVQLEATATKNRKAVKFPLVPELLDMLERRAAITAEVEQRKGMRISAVFHRDGTPCRWISKSWNTAKRKAGLPGKVFHELRGTATTNLFESATPLHEVMDMVGFKTVQTAMRYAKTREESLREAGQRLVARLAEQRKRAKNTP